MEGLGTAILIVSIAGILGVIVAVIQLVVAGLRLRQPDTRPDRRGWLLMAGSFIVATALGVGAFVGFAGGTPFILVAALVGIATFVLMLVAALGQPNRTVVLAFGVGVALELGMFLGFFLLPRLPLTGDLLSRMECERDPYCQESSAVVNTTATVTLHLAGDAGWLLDARGQMACRLDPRPAAGQRLILTGSIEASDGGKVRIDLGIGEYDEIGGSDQVSMEMDRMAMNSGIYPRGPTLVIEGQGALARGQAKLVIDGVGLQRPGAPNESRPDIKGTLQWACDVTS